LFSTFKNKSGTQGAISCQLSAVSVSVPRHEHSQDFFDRAEPQFG
jgi:hypothetical protein